MSKSITEEAEQNFINACKARFNCSRDWEAWQIGTMTVDDFSPLEEDEDFIGELMSILEQSIQKSIKEVYEDWEIAIRYSENDEDEVPLEKRQLSELVMENHLKMSKEKLSDLSQK